MFDPQEFLVLAQNLASQATDEKIARACIGRAYFAAHLCARERIRRFYPRGLLALRPKGIEHQFVRDKLVEKGHPNIATKLDGLAKKRGRADYELNNYSSDAEKRKEVANAIQLCQNIVSLLTGVV
jgi:hypothetical protein